MKPKSIFAGALLIALGLVFLAYYGAVYKPDKAAGRLLREARLIHERGDRESINHSLDVLTTLVATYPNSKYVPDAMFLIADAYEKNGLYRLAYLKYSSISSDPLIKRNSSLDNEVTARLAALKIKRNYSEEGIAQLISLVSSSTDPEFRSRVYTEIGYARLRLGSFSDAEKSFLTALRENPENEEAMLGKEKALAHQGKTEEPVTQPDTTRKTAENKAVTSDYKRLTGIRIYQAGLANVRSGRYRSARSRFREFIRKYPASKYVENSYYWMGESYYATGRYSTAVTWFNRALSNRWRHKDEDAKIKIGFSYYMMGKYDLAAREFNSYLAWYPSGRYRSTARQWKESSSRRIINRIGNSTADTSRVIQGGLDEQMRGYSTRSSYSDNDDPESVTEL